MQTGLRPSYFISPFFVSFERVSYLWIYLGAEKRWLGRMESMWGGGGGRQECGPGEGTSMYVHVVKRSLGKKKPVGAPGVVEHTHDLSTESGGLLVGSLPVLQ